MKGEDVVVQLRCYGMLAGRFLNQVQDRLFASAQYDKNVLMPYRPHAVDAG